MADEASFASADWVALLADAYGKLPARPGATAVVEHVATGGPDGEVSYWTAFEDGRLADAGAGHHAAPTVTLPAISTAIPVATTRSPTLVTAFDTGGDAAADVTASGVAACRTWPA